LVDEVALLVLLVELLAAVVSHNMHLSRPQEVAAGFFDLGTPYQILSFHAKQPLGIVGGEDIALLP
jgi:hypothetical protein